LYTRETRRNNHTIRFGGAGRPFKYGEIKYFLKNPITSKIFCVVSVFKVDITKMLVNRSKQVVVRHLIPVSEGNDTELVEFDKSVSKMIRVGDYVCVPPNTIKKRF